MKATTKTKSSEEQNDEKEEGRILMQTWIEPSTLEELRLRAKREDRTVAYLVRKILERATSSERAFKEAMGR